MLATATSLTVAILVGSSWYFAEKIRSEALAVEPGTAMPAYDDVQFVGLSPGQAQLIAIGDQPALSKPELYGVAWQGGVGHLGASVAVSNGEITRPLTVTSGLAPKAGQLAALEQGLFPRRRGNGVGNPHGRHCRTGPGRAAARVVLPGPEQDVCHRRARAERDPQGRAAHRRHCAPHGISRSRGDLPQRPRRRARPVRLPPAWADGVA